MPPFLLHSLSFYGWAGIAWYGITLWSVCLCCVLYQDLAHQQSISVYVEMLNTAHFQLQVQRTTLWVLLWENWTLYQPPPRHTLHSRKFSPIGCLLIKEKRPHFRHESSIYIMEVGKNTEHNAARTCQINWVQIPCNHKQSGYALALIWSVSTSVLYWKKKLHYQYTRKSV